MAHHGQVETFVCFSGNGEQLCAAIQRLVPPETIAREVPYPDRDSVYVQDTKMTFPSMTHRVAELGRNLRD